MTDRPGAGRTRKKADAVFYPQRVGAGRRGVVATAHWCATEAGAEAFAAGGNAVDAAVAAAFALGVCEPAASGLGGQTAMLLHIGAERRTFALDGSSRAPHRTPPSELQTAERLRGHRATTVPSTVAALGYALETHGTLPLDVVLRGAIRLAKDGYPISELQHRLTTRESKHLRANTAAPLFLIEGKRVRPVGDQFRQPVLARTLTRLAEAGWRDFYQGEIAAEIATDMERNNGLIQLDDLAQIPLPIDRRPVSSRFGGLRVFTFPPPGAGRTLLEILGLLEQFTEKRRDLETPDGAALFAEIVRRANLDRQDRPFDPNFYPQVDERQMLSEEYAKRVAREIRRRVWPPRPRGNQGGADAQRGEDASGPADAGTPKGETTHLTTMDADGNVVALTQSIERVYGSFAASPKLGFLYNNYMSAFEHADISHPYYLRPNAVPWASVAPTIVMRGRKPFVALGSPGSERIASAIAQVLLRLQDRPLPDAVAAPRLHCSLRGEVAFEQSRMRSDVGRRLESMGFQLRPLEPFAFYLGCVQAVQATPDGLLGVADIRRDGAAMGYDG